MPTTKRNRPAISVADIRRRLSEEEFHEQKAKIESAEKILEDVKALLSSVLFLRNGKLSAASIEYAAFRVETLSLIFEVAARTFQAANAKNYYSQFLDDLGEEVGFTFARDLIERIRSHGLFDALHDPRILLDLWASYENETGAGVTKIASSTQTRVVIHLANNPLRRAESSPHAHCGFYTSYIASLLNEIYTLRPRIIQSEIKLSSVTAFKVSSVKEQPDPDDGCVFVVECRPEHLTEAFDLLAEAFDRFYELEGNEDFGQCVVQARGALVKAQTEALGWSGQAPRHLYKVYSGLLSRQEFRRMDDAFQRASRSAHAESRSSGTTTTRAAAWVVLRDIRRSVYALEMLELDDRKREGLRQQVEANERLGVIEQLIGQLEDMPASEKQEVQKLLSQLREGKLDTEETQSRLARMLHSIGGRVWEVARPVMSDVLSAAAKKELGL